MTGATPSDGASVRVGIVGGGLAGLTAARVLVRRGFAVTVFDKARKAGGRMSTRRVADPTGDLSFDHGAQYFTARTRAFARLVESLRRRGVVDAWTGRLVSVGDTQMTPVANDGQPTRWVGVPTMSAVPGALSEGLHVIAGTLIVALERAAGSKWHLRDHDGGVNGPFDIVLLATPAPQAQRLLKAGSTLEAKAAAAVMQPSWALMVTVASGPSCEYDGAFVSDSPLRWVMRQPSKPGRPTHADAWVLHATPAWTERHWDTEASEVGAELLAAWAQRGGPEPQQVSVVSVQRWRYALAGDTDEGAAFDPDENLGLCGDWLGGPRVEGAFVSGRALAARVLWNRRAGRS